MSVTKVFERIETLVPTLHGWCTIEKAHALAASVFALKPDITVEIGVWGGRSLLPMALAHRELGRGIVWGIDPWEVSSSVKGQLGENLKWWAQINHEIVRNDFLAKVDQEGVRNVVKVIHATSDVTEPPPKIDLLHIDGNHSDQAVKDVERFAVRVRVGGLVFMDDIAWEGGGVMRAVARLKGLGFVSLYQIDTGEMFQRIAP